MTERTAFSVRDLTRLALLLAAALVLGFVESLFPLPVPIPGIKLGLANIAVLLCLYLFGFPPAFFLALGKVLLSALLYAGFSGLLYALPAAVLSLCLMALMKRCVSSVSILGVSLLGGAMHNACQCLFAVLFTHTPALFAYLPLLLLSGGLTGLLTGACAKGVLSVLRRKAGS
ncbi:MAG: Gx transporter family protein [Clostridia bacterium]|nr:Gx transporter family protein [Clostridia bacterium]